MTKNIFSRSWYYFRNGWTTYFAFIFAAINTLTVTYYLAVERYPTLQIVFPNFIHYVLIITIIGVPFLIFLGYIHYKKTSAFRSEVDIGYESNPYALRILINSELLLKLNLQLIDKIVRLSKEEKLTEDEIKELISIENEIKNFSSQRNFQNKKDLEFFKKLLNEK